MSFYRIYRPNVVGEIDNIAVREFLLSLLTKDKKDLPHAYLFTGPRGAGKTTAARLIAKLFNCTSPTPASGPCGRCNQCTAIAQGISIDVLEIDAASNRGIEEIRSLRDGIALTPVEGGYKLYIIDEVHMLTPEAFNALLKTLEEPPKHAIFILATTDRDKVPVTIKSRCITVSFHKATNEEIRTALLRIIRKEKLDIDEKAIDSIVDQADGSFRDAVKYLEQVTFHTGKITLESVRKVLNLASDTAVVSLLEALAAKDAPKGLEIVQELVSEGKDFRSMLSDVLRFLEQHLVDSVNGASDGMSIADTKDLIRRLTAAYTQMKGFSIPHLPLELAIVEYCADDRDESTQQISKASVANEKQRKNDTDVIAAPHADVREKTVSNAKHSTDAAVQATDTAEVLHASHLGLITVERLVECWKDVIEALKPYNHSVAGVLRSARPKQVAGGIVTIEAFYTFHQEKLSETKTKEAIATVLHKLFGEKVNVSIVLGKK